MEPASFLTADPLSFRTAGLTARALARLHRGAGTMFVLRGADPALAPLTRPRLMLLLEPPRGDAALSAALARSASNGEDGASVSDPAPQRLGAHERASAAETRRRALPAQALRGRRALALPRRRATAQHRGEAASARTGNPTSLHGKAGVIVTAAAPAQRSTALQPHGLHPFAERAPGGAAAATSRLPAKRNRSNAGATTGDQDAGGLPATAGAAFAPGRPSALLPTPTTTHATAAPDPDRPATRARPTKPPRTTVDAIAITPAMASGLEMLVRAWADADASEPGTTVTEPPVATTADTARSRVQPAVVSAAGHRLTAQAVAPTATRDDQQTDVADTFGRMLVAELRRYGIEVDAG